MAAIKKILPHNRIASSPHYGKILQEYNERYTRDGRVNNKEFYLEFIKPLIPNYSLRGWYDFVQRFKDGGINAVILASKGEVEVSTQEKALMSNQTATASLIQNLLNIGADRAKQIAENPSLLTAKEAVELALKGMRAQDSRIHAIGKIREDNREQEKFDKAFSGASYE